MSRIYFICQLFGIVLAYVVVSSFSVHHQLFADEYSSVSFKVLDPVLFPAGYSTSSGFSLTSTIAQIAIGTSTVGVGTARENRSGFEYFPFVNSPIVSATPGSAQVALSWTASVGVLGWTVSGYRVGQATVSGGAYTYSNVGNVLSGTQSGLTNGTTYYFVVNPLDAFGRAIATSSEVSATPIAGGGSGSGGGGGSYTPPNQTPASQSGTLNFSGSAYPLGVVHLLRDGAIIKSTTTDMLGNFTISTILPAASNYQLGFSGLDTLGRFSSLLVVDAAVGAGQVKNISGIFLSPTLDADKESVRVDDSLGISGYAYPNSTVTLLVSRDPLFVNTVRTVEIPVALSGWYTYRFTVTDDFSPGLYFGKTRWATGGNVSALSEPVQFIVADESKKKEARECRLGDLNDDGHVDLVDFSIATYWYKKSPLREPFASKEAACLNNDHKVDLYDFSLMAYYWTG